MAWVRALTSRHYNDMLNSESAMSFRSASTEALPAGVTPETLELAHRLTFDIPGATWTIEVDFLGHHRVTIHFEGASISLDEP